MGTNTKRIRDLRWGPCPHCGAKGWNTPGPFNLDPAHNHDRPDGKRCRKAEIKHTGKS